MDSLVYTRQKDIPLKLSPNVAIAGCGGVGSWVAILLAMSGVGELHLFDADTVGIENLNRLPFGPDTVGKLKVQVLRGFIIGIRPKARVYSYPMMFNKMLLAMGPKLLVDCTDDGASQREIYQACKGRVPYIRAGCNGIDHWTISSSVPGWGSGGQGRYDVVPSWVAPAVLTACLAVFKALYQDADFSGGLEDIANIVGLESECGL